MSKTWFFEVFFFDFNYSISIIEHVKHKKKLEDKTLEFDDRKFIETYPLGPPQILLAKHLLGHNLQQPWHAK